MKILSTAGAFDTLCRAGTRPLRIMAAQGEGADVTVVEGHGTPEQPDPVHEAFVAPGATRNPPIVAQAAAAGSVRQHGAEQSRAWWEGGIGGRQSRLR